MNVTEALDKRRAIKHYDADHKMSDTDFDSLMAAALKSPSSFNIQHWRIVDVQDQDKRAKIRAAAWDQAQVTDASKLLVLCADIKAWEKNTAQYWRTAPEEVANMMVPMTKDFYDGREWIQRDEAIRSVGIIGQSIMLAATEIGYDTCPMIGFDQEVVSEIINLPDDHLIGMFVVVGKRTKEPFEHGGRIDQNVAVITDSF